MKTHLTAEDWIGKREEEPIEKQKMENELTTLRTQRFGELSEALADTNKLLSELLDRLSPITARQEPAPILEQAIREISCDMDAQVERYVNQVRLINYLLEDRINRLEI